MANRDFKKIERVMKDFSLNLGGGSGGTIPVNKLPEKGNVGEFYLLPNGEIYTFVHQEKEVPIYKETLEAGDAVEFLYKAKDLGKDEIFDTLGAISSWMPKAGSIILNEVPTIASGNQLVGYVQSTHDGPFDIVVASNTGEEIGKASYNESNTIEMVSVEGDLAIPLTITITQEILDLFERASLNFLTDLVNRPIIGYKTVVTEWWQKTNGALIINLTHGSFDKTIYLDDADYDSASIVNSVLNGGDVRVHLIYDESNPSDITGIALLGDIHLMFGETGLIEGAELTFYSNNNEFHVSAYLYNEPDRVKFMIGDNIDVPGYGQVQCEVLSCSKTFDEIVEMYNADPDNTETKCTFKDGYEQIGKIITAQKNGDSYYFEFEPQGQLGTSGLAWDNENQKFLYWNGVM